MRKNQRFELNEINQRLQDELKSITDPQARDAARSHAKILRDSVMARTSDDLQLLNQGNKIKFQDVPSRFSPQKKLLSVLPFAGVGMAALSGDPAMAAEELAQDAMGPAGLAYEAIRPEVAGNPEDDQILEAESGAFKDYQNSPAAKDVTKFRNIRSSLGIK